MKKYFIQFLLSFTIYHLPFTIVFAQQQSISGKIIDKKTKEPLAFVTILANNNLQGSISDIDGKFFITNSNKITLLRFSYVGYEQLSITITDSIFNLKNLIISLTKKSIQLKEVVIESGENPAHRIIKLVTENKDKNNPEKIKSFSYTSYNKFIVTPKIDTALNVKKNITDSLNLDTNYRNASKIAEKQHIFLMESVSERIFKQPDRNDEKIIASRISGLQDPLFSMLATQLQSFSFYNDYITIYEKNYLNPISKGSTNKYFFLLKDTLYSNNDTIFIISYQPKKGKNFDGMRGLLYINTNGYALQNVVAIPTDADIRIQQKYEFIEQRQWFPVQLNTDIIFSDIQIDNFPLLVAMSRSYVENIVLEPDLKDKKFTKDEIEISDEAGKKDELFWQKYRRDSLTTIDKKTYQINDSIGNAAHLDAKIKAVETMMLGKLPFKFIDFDLDKFIEVNEYEGFRLGVGIHTNNKISKFVSVGGYFAYGFKDKAMKYGSDISVNIHKKSELKLNFSYAQDVIESGGVDFSFDRKPMVSETYRSILISKMDSIQKMQAALSFRMFQYLQFNISINQNSRKVTYKNDYYYGTENEKIKIKIRQYDFTEAALGVRFAFREKFMKTPRMSYSIGTNYPVLWLQFSKGLDNFLNGNYEYSRFDFKIERTFTIKNFGKPTMQIVGGIIDGDLPYTMLYNGKGSALSSNKKLNVSAMNSFETMLVNEFLSNQYLSVFYSHNFGSLLYKTKKFKPEFILINNAGWGQLSNKDKHHSTESVQLKTMEKGYFETGILLNKLLVSGISGFGIGGFYRYGPYSDGDSKNNIMLKLALSFEL